MDVYVMLDWTNVLTINDRRVVIVELLLLFYRKIIDTTKKTAPSLGSP